MNGAGAVGTISRIPPVITGETITSWLARLADHNLAPQGWAVHATGLAASAAHADQPAGLIVTLTDAQALAVYRTTGIPADTLRAMTLSAWVGSVVDDLPLTPDGEVDNRVFARTNWTHPRGTPYCPTCLTDHGAYLLAWRNPLTTVCLAHECMLVSVCPRCGKAPQDGHGDGTLRSGFLTRQPTRGTCSNTFNLHGTILGAGSQPCGNNLTHTPTEEAPSALLDLQARLDQRLEPSVENRAFWTDLRALVAVILAVGTVEHGALCGVTLPESLADEWAAHQTARDTSRADNTRINKALNRDHKQGARDRYWTTTPTNPTLTAAALLAAELALTDDDVLHAVCITRRASGRANGLSALVASHPTPELLERARCVIDSRSGTTTSTGFHTRRAVPSPIAHLAVNIPPLMWDDVYAACFETMLDGVPAERDTFRRLCSVALHKHLTANTWHASGERFADEQYRNRNIANATLDRMKKHRDGLAEQFLTTISELAAALETDPSRLAGE